MSETNSQKHFVLVHGAGHGAWCWYKIKPRLESAGHKVTALDNAGSGIDTKSIEDFHSLEEYSEPLLQFIGSLAPQEKVILVGHSLGGMNLSVAMEKFPEKISAAVFLTAFLPDTTHHPSYVMDQVWSSLNTHLDFHCEWWLSIHNLIGKYDRVHHYSTSTMFLCFSIQIP